MTILLKCYNLKVYYSFTLGKEVINSIFYHLLVCNLLEIILTNSFKDNLIFSSKHSNLFFLLVTGKVKQSLVYGTFAAITYVTMFHKRKNHFISRPKLNPDYHNITHLSPVQIAFQPCKISLIKNFVLFMTPYRFSLHVTNHPQPNHFALKSPLRLELSLHTKLYRKTTL